MTSNPFRYVVQVAGAGRYALRIADARLARGDRDDRLRSRASAGRSAATAAPSSSRRSRRPAAPREIGFTRAAGRRAGAGARARATAGRCARATCRSGGTAFAPDAFPFRLPDIESETDNDRGLELFKAPAARQGGRACLADAAGRPDREGAGRRRRASG